MLRLNREADTRVDTAAALARAHPPSAVDFDAPAPSAISTTLANTSNITPQNGFGRAIDLDAPPPTPNTATTVVGALNHCRIIIPTASVNGFWLSEPAEKWG